MTVQRFVERLFGRTVEDDIEVTYVRLSEDRMRVTTTVRGKSHASDVIVFTPNEVEKIDAIKASQSAGTSLSEHSPTPALQ